MEEELDKAPAILQTLDRLKSRLGSQAFVVVDHWETDPHAVGIASPRNPGVLAYISTYEEASGRYYVELELPALPDGGNIPYALAGTYANVDFERLNHLIKDHLARG